MVARLAPIATHMLRVLIVLFTAEIAVVSILKYFTSMVEPPEPVVANAFANPFLVIHVIGGVVALLVGPLQFVRRIRERRPALHHASGRIFVVSCLVGAPSGFALALGTVAGPVAAVGFAIPALLWPLFTILGVRAVLERRIDDHREWMLRSYAITANAITLRLLLPAAGLLGFSFFDAYPVVAWLGWIMNLAGVEYYIRRNRAAATPMSGLAAA